jgi:prepilin-type N-terminal cleavage/methylation domain-containing protein
MVLNDSRVIKLKVRKISNMKDRIFRKVAGFTLVELLIVIALISILAVAVLATINPIEQSNKARDARVQNDAAEVMNAYERYYASLQAYPWQYFTTNPLTSGDLVVFRSDDYGFGICSGAGTAAALLGADATGQAGGCDSADPYPNLLISTSELKSSFAGKDEFEPVLDGTHVEQAMWTVKAQNANSIYVCYIPKANANRVDAAKMRCINGATGVVDKIGTGSCLAFDEANDDWDTPTLDGVVAMFKCVPE